MRPGGGLAGDADAAGRRLLVVADSDSYVKWGAALASKLPAPWRVDLVVLASPVQPSATQLAHALAGTAFSPERTRVVHLDELDGLVDALDPHAVLLSLRGPFVRVVAPRLERRPNRPVLVSGFPGLTIPAVPKAVVYREQTDLVVLHSRREVREFRANAAELGIGTVFALATLPFLLTERPHAASDRSDVVFAAQAKVPAAREDRVHLLAGLAELARRQPARRVVVKVRARSGEAQTHAEAYDYAELMPEVDAPANLVIEDGPMAEKLAHAGALVTVSSTAALEAVSLEIPALLVDDYGVSPAMINTVFEGSGLLGSVDELVAGAFRAADASWLADNYFHPSSADDWVRRLASLVEAREIVPLRRLVRRRDLAGGRLRVAFERRRMLGEHDRSLLGAVAWAVGVPARGAVRRARRLRRRFGRAGGDAVGAGPTAPIRSVDGGGVEPGVTEVGLRVPVQ
ncbi:hypothetical protein BJ978_000059 [Agromyces terreus]|uniref:Uncharacterized protein n=1 Tax=Agromyces terreus TaxID=424795 RepID=A0A9X2K9L9_9MICO|nr:DUF6716 putative glycosyltransferase [Agromyces terreus]MCP2369383.1 hypothetical protein [Agromyces terreus]